MSIKGVLGGAAAVVGAGLTYANLETRLFEIKHVPVPILPPGQPDIRVLQMADLHYPSSQHTKTRWLESLGKLQPDLVVNTGDNVSSRASIPALLDVLEAAGLLDVPGVFVGGSNDYYAPILKNPLRYLSHNGQIPMDLPPLPWRELFDGFESHGWVNLNNRRAIVQLASGQAIDFVGTDDAHHENDEFPPPSAKPQGSTVAHIGVTHAPYLRVLQQFKDDGVSLVIAGHTHGGQLRIPGYGAIVTNCDLDRKRAEGGYTVGQAAGLLRGIFPGRINATSDANDSIWLYVSAGAGTSPYTPFRFDCRPSATLLTLTAADR